MEVLEIEGARGRLTNVVPSVWKSDETTVRILLDNPKSEKWLLISLDIRDLIREIARFN